MFNEIHAALEKKGTVKVHVLKDAKVSFEVHKKTNSYTAWAKYLAIGTAKILAITLVAYAGLFAYLALPQFIGFAQALLTHRYVKYTASAIAVLGALTGVYYGYCRYHGKEPKLLKPVKVNLFKLLTA